MKRVLITGGCGFIGHHLVEQILKVTDWNLVLLDRLDISGNLGRLKDISCFEENKHRVKWVWHDLRAPISGLVRNQIGEIDTIFHLAAATHVDRSIQNPLSFVYDNVVATCNVLDFVRLCRDAGEDIRVLYFSTDEVFGPAPYGVNFKEWDRYRSGNPYAATKAGAEELCLAFQNTYGIPVLISHCMNVFGERQHPEKFIPSTIKKVLAGEKVTIHADKTKTVPGSRFYIHARNVAAAALFILEHGVSGEKYNVVGEKEVNNLELAQLIADMLDKALKYELVSFHESRPGHDLRYGLDGSKMEGMGWKLPVNFEESLRQTVQWSVEHSEWL